MNDERSFRDELNNVIKSWPGSAESKRAGEIIAFLNQKTPELKVEEDKKIANELYVDDKTVPHTFCLVISDPAFNINQASFDVISYNIDNYTNKNFKTPAELIEKKFVLITVTGYADYNQSMDYFNTCKTDKAVRNTTSARMMTFLINDNNLRVLKNDKDPERYLLFFNEKYLKKADAGSSAIHK